METIMTTRQDSETVQVPEKYWQPPRLAVWYRHGFGAARRGFVHTAGWLQRLAEDEPAADAYRDGYRDGDALRGDLPGTGGPGVSVSEEWHFPDDLE